MSQCLCFEIECPYWSNSSKKSYGCQFYSVASACHLTKAKQFEWNEYGLYGEFDESEIQQLKAVNEKYLIKSERYQKDREIQQEHPDFDKEYPNRIIEITVSTKQLLNVIRALMDRHTESYVATAIAEVVSDAVSDQILIDIIEALSKQV